MKIIKSNDRVFIHGACAAPQKLIYAMTNRAKELRNVELVHIHLEADTPYVKPEYAENFHCTNLFTGASCRKAVQVCATDNHLIFPQEGRADFVPVFLSEIPSLFYKGVMPIDVALVHVSPPDAHGFVSLGTSVDVALAAVTSAKTVVAQVNPNMPRTHGTNLWFGSDIT